MAKRDPYLDLIKQMRDEELRMHAGFLREWEVFKTNRAELFQTLEGAVQTGSTMAHKLREVLDEDIGRFHESTRRRKHEFKRRWEKKLDPHKDPSTYMKPYEPWTKRRARAWAKARAQRRKERQREFKQNDPTEPDRLQRFRSEGREATRQRETAGQRKAAAKRLTSQKRRAAQRQSAAQRRETAQKRAAEAQRRAEEAQKAARKAARTVARKTANRKRGQALMDKFKQNDPSRRDPDHDLDP
ncbi:MAG: hypothetical protein AAFR95_13925 [Bacteroidota bacterium]